MDSQFIMEASNEYEKAIKLGKKSTREMPVLDDILKEKNITGAREIPLGLIQIPMDQLVGTKTKGRAGAFRGDFLPALAEGTEFASKWQSLYAAHLEEGIRDPIKAYEFMNKFYVEEGNKRVSVLKYFGAVSIPGEVTRIVPPPAEDKETKIYYEFMDFYALSGVNYIWFSKLKSFALLQRTMGKGPDEKWTDDDKLNFNSAYTRFEAEFIANGGKKLDITTGDAFLYFMSLYDYQKILDMTTADFKTQMGKMWEDFKLLETDDAVQLQSAPEAADKKKKNTTGIKKINTIASIPGKILPGSNKVIKVAFLYERTPDESGWTYIHELGRQYAEEQLNGQIVTRAYQGIGEGNAEETLNQAIEEGCTVIFATAPTQMKACMKVAIEHPKVRILNCSLNRPSKYVRTYYARMYEAKFLMGAIAGSMSESGRIGYIADYPIFGMTANINAFALGAQMVNPRAKVYLEWFTLKDHDVIKSLDENGIDIISGKDTISPINPSRHFGVFRRDEETALNLAMPVWNFGKFYVSILQNIINGEWKYDETEDETKGLNYYWGMSSGIVDVVCSNHLPNGTIRLINLLRDTIARGGFNPFTGVLHSQNGLVQSDPERQMTFEEIINMDWLAENIVGFIPTKDQLVDTAKPVVARVGIETKQESSVIV